MESSVRGLGTPHSSCSGSRAGLGSPPKPGRSRRHPRSLRCRRRRGACSSSPSERPASCQCAGATAWPRGRTGTSQAGRSDSNKGQWRGAGAPGTRQRPLAVTHYHAARREGLGKGAAEPRSGVSGVGRGGTRGTPLQQPTALCFFLIQLPTSLHIASSLRTEPRAHYRSPTSFPGPLTHSEHPITQGPCLPPLLPISLILHALAAKRLSPRSLSPSLVSELTDATPFPGRVLGAETTDMEKTLPWKISQSQVRLQSSTWGTWETPVSTFS